MHKMKGVVLVGSFPYEDDHLIACSECSFFNTFLFFTNPDFWVSRIDPDLITYSSNLVLLKDYFRRNHDYRRNNHNHKTHIYSISLPLYYADAVVYYTHILESMGDLIPDLIYHGDVFWESVNEADAAITEISVHGDSSIIAIGDSYINSEEIFYKSHSKSSFIDLHACNGGNPVNNNPASAFLFAENSKVLAVSARAGSASYASSMTYAHYLNSTNKVIGDIFLKKYSWANHVLPGYHRRILLGDGTLNLGE